MTYDDFRCRARAGNLTITAVGRTQPKDHLSPDSNCLVRRGRDTTQFWFHFVDQPKYFDGAPEPLECGAVQIISNWIKARRATVLYPFSGSQYPPVYTWAPRDGSCHCFAAEMLVHDQADLLGALIGALTVSEQHEQPTSPTVLKYGCQTRLCLQACPQSACDATGYNGDLCWSHHCTRDNTSCLTTGWAAQLTFPKSHQAGRSTPRHPCFI